MTITVAFTLMSLWLLLTIPTLWLIACAVAVSLCVTAARGDRTTIVAQPVLPDRHTERRPLRLQRARAASPHVTRLHR